MATSLNKLYLKAHFFPSINYYHSLKMRLTLTTTPNKSLVPFNYQPKLVGAFHKWLGKNQEHDEISLYSFSWLAGGKAIKNGLNFKFGASWTLSSFNNELIKTLVKGIREAPELFYGMEVKEIVLQEAPEFSKEELFRLLSPVFIKRNIEGKSKYFYYNDVDASTLLTETLRTKLKKAGLDDKNVSVSFYNDYPNPQTKMIDYNGIKCRASMCPVVIKGTSEQIAFAWKVGVGNSTGIGFGALK